MQFIAWSKLKDWLCNACGWCCSEFKVPLRLYETSLLANIFGYECMESRVGTFYLRRRADGRCIFQVKESEKLICGIQPLKPMACRMWPFIVCERPDHGYREESSFDFRGETFYVYANPCCRCLVYGRPSLRLINFVLPEFIEMKLGMRTDQVRSTSPFPKIPNLHTQIASTPRSGVRTLPLFRKEIFLKNFQIFWT